MSSIFINDGNDKHKSRLIKAMEDVTKSGYTNRPSGMFGAEAKVMCNGVTIDSNELDLDFRVPFDDDLEPNEAEITVYNLTDSTIKKFLKGKKVTITAGFNGDTGIVFQGVVDRVKTKQESCDKVTTINCFDDVSEKKIESISFAAGTKASTILKKLIGKTGMPIAVMKIKRDHVYKDAVTVDGDLMENIRKYSEVCGVSTYVYKGMIYCRHITDGDECAFRLNSDTGMIGSPVEFEEEVTAEDFKETVTGYDVEMLLQYRMQVAAIVKLESKVVKGEFRVRSGEHSFTAGGEATTKVKVM